MQNKSPPRKTILLPKRSLSKPEKKAVMHKMMPMMKLRKLIKSVLVMESLRILEEKKMMALIPESCWRVLIEIPKII